MATCEPRVSSAVTAKVRPRRIFLSKFLPMEADVERISGQERSLPRRDSLAGMQCTTRVGRFGTTSGNGVRNLPTKVNREKA